MSQPALMNELASAIAGIGSLTRQLTALRGHEIYGELQEAVNVVHSQVAQALASNLSGLQEQAALHERVKALEEQCLTLQQQLNDRSGYALKELGPGAFAYVYQPPIDGGKPEHWACTNCFTNGHISILQKKYRIGHVCHRCKLELQEHLIRGAQYDDDE